MARKRVIKKKEAMKAAVEKAQLTEEKKAAEKVQLTEGKKTAEETQPAEEKVVEKVSDTAKEIKATAAKEVKEAKEAVKKTAAKRPSKKYMKVRTFVEYYGKHVEEKEMIARVKKAWTKKGKRVGEIKTLELYVKPEEGAVYYVINSEETGAVEY